MKKNISSLLRRILNDTAAETALARSKESMKRVKQMVKDALPLLSFEDALSTGNALIAEIKERSPSQGKMIPGNVKVAPVAYKESRLVKAISVLTNRSHFGKSMGVNELWRIKEITNKPVLRKDFITDEYQAYQARAYGADAILLMANILEADELKKLSDIAFELGMDVLFETHCAEELESLPSTARIVGINCRNFDAHPLNPVSGFAVSKFFRQWLGKSTDKSTNTNRFSYADQLGSEVIKVAESGITPSNCAEVFSLGFNAVLVGNSLLMDDRGISKALADFEMALKSGKAKKASASHVLSPVTA